MNSKLNRFAIPGLRWTVGLVVALQSVRFVISPSAAHFLAKQGLPGWIRPLLGTSEIAAVLLFLIPATRWVGGYLLLFIFLIAGLIHVLHGELDISSLILYGAAVIACMVPPNQKTAKGAA